MEICHAQPKAFDEQDPLSTDIRWDMLPANVQAIVVAKLSAVDAARVGSVDRNLNRLASQAPHWQHLLTEERASGPMPNRPRRHIGTCLNNVVVGAGSRLAIRDQLNAHQTPLLHELLDSENLWQAQLSDWQSDEASNRSDAEQATKAIQAARCQALTALELPNLTIRTLPKCVGHLMALEQLCLDGCSHIESLPESIGYLPALWSLSLDGCNRLESLPESMGRLTTLWKFCVDGCSRLKSLPQSMEQLTDLQGFFLNDCSSLESLPQGIGQATALRWFSLKNCSHLTALPNSADQLTKLRWLSLDHCSRLGALPESVGRLTALQSLSFDGCKNLQLLPESIGELTCLEGLSLNHCSRLESLPESIGQLTRLERLSLDHCSRLESLPGAIGQLTALHWLYFDGCSRLKSLSFAEQFHWTKIDERREHYVVSWQSSVNTSMATSAFKMPL